MVDLTLDQALPVVKDLAGRKANAFVRRCGLGAGEREDVESHLVLTFVARWPKFDAGKASVRTFASRVMDKELTSILRYRLAGARQPQDIPPPAAPPDTAARSRFRVDVERAVAPLPVAVRETAWSLLWCSTGEAAESLHCSRQMVARRKQQIRDAFLARGIGPNYFVAGGAQ